MLGKQVFAGDLGSISVSIFSSSCYGFANSTAALFVHSGWVLVVYSISKKDMTEWLNEIGIACLNL